MVNGVRDQGRWYTIAGDFVLFGCKVTQGTSESDMYLALDGQFSGDEAHLNPDIQEDPIRHEEYPNIALIYGDMFEIVNVNTDDESSDDLLVDDAPTTSGFGRYDIVYAFIGQAGPALGILTGEASEAVKTDFDSNGLDLAAYPSTFDAVLPHATLPLARVYVQTGDTGIANARIADLRDFTGRLTTGGGGATGAPTGAQYLVAATHSDLSAERAVVSTTSILVDFGTTGQAKFKRAAITGHVTIDEDSNTAAIPADTVTNVLAANMAANTVKMNPTGSAADPQDVVIPASSVLGRGASGNAAMLGIGTGLNVVDGDLVCTVESGSGGAPTDVEYIVAASNGGLSAERVATSSTSILVSFATAAQAIFKRAAISGDIVIDEDSNTATLQANTVGTTELVDGGVTAVKIPDGELPNAKFENMAAFTIKMNNTESPAAPQDVTRDALFSSLPVGFKYIYDIETAAADPTAGKLRLSETDLTLSGLTLYLSYITDETTDLENFINPTYMKPGGFIKLRGVISDNVYLGALTTVVAGIGYGTIGLVRVASSATFTDGEALVFEYSSNGNVTFNSTTGNLEVNGVSIGPPGGGAGVQQFFSFTYDQSVIVDGDPGVGKIRFNFADSVSATECYLDNRTNDITDPPNLRNYYALIRPGWQMHVYSKIAARLTVYIITSTEEIGGSTGYRKIVFTGASPAGISLVDGEDVRVLFIPAGNMEYDQTDGFVYVNGTVVSGISKATTFATLPDASSGDYDDEVYLAESPRIWMDCDGVLNAWRPLNGIARLYRNSTPIKLTAPATLASAIADNGSGKVRVTANSHLMTSTQNNFYVYISAWSGTGVAGQYRVTYVSANTYDLPDLAYNAGLGTPTVAIANGTAEILAAEIDLPPLTGRSCVRLEHSSVVTASDEDKRFCWALMTAGRTGAVELNNRNTTAVANPSEFNKFAFRNLGVTNSQQALIAESANGAPASHTSVPNTAGVETNVATKLKVYLKLTAGVSSVQNYTINDLVSYLED